MEDQGTYKTWQNLNKKILKIIQNIEEGDIEEMEQGSVLYISKVDKNN